MPSGLDVRVAKDDTSSILKLLGRRHGWTVGKCDPNKGRVLTANLTIYDEVVVKRSFILGPGD